LHCLWTRENGEEYEVEVNDKHIFLLTNAKDQRNFSLVYRDLPTLSAEGSDKPVLPPLEDPSWKTLIPHDYDTLLSSVLPFKRFLVVTQRYEGLPRVQIFPLCPETGVPQVEQAHFLKFPEDAYSCHLNHNEEADTDYLRLNYSSFVTPQTAYEYHMEARQLFVRKQKEILGDYDPSLYVVERCHATAADGVDVPVSLVRRKDCPMDGTSKCYLTGYGSYGYSDDPSFSYRALSLLERNFVYAVAHIRGGAEKGRYWYEDGKLLKKKNTFEDFATVARYLVNQNYTSPAHMAIYGASAGGLLIGAVVNSYGTKLCSVAVASVPFVDVVTTMLDDSLPLTAIEWEEWGNPQDKEYYDYIKSYSPYDNVKAKSYPHMLIRAGLNDNRVQYFEPAKYCAKLRTHKTNHNLLLLKTNTESGHFGSSGRYEALKEDAYEYAFIINQLDPDAAVKE